MHFSCDRTGFPLVGLPSLALEIQLWPVTKPQFERFLAETRCEGDIYYDMLLEYNPRISIINSTPVNREGVFITGVMPDEARSYANWLGAGFRLPTLLEWRSAYTVMARNSLSMDLLKKVLHATPHSLPRMFLKRMEAFTPNHHMNELSLMSGGIFEWVTNENKWLGIGAPRQIFTNHILDPLHDCNEMIGNIRRDRCFGFRLVRTVG